MALKHCPAACFPGQSDNRKLPSLKKKLQAINGECSALDADARIAVSASHGTATTTVQYRYQIIMPPGP